MASPTPPTLARSDPDYRRAWESYDAVIEDAVAELRAGGHVEAAADIAASHVERLVEAGFEQDAKPAAYVPEDSLSSFVPEPKLVSTDKRFAEAWRRWYQEVARKAEGFDAAGSFDTARALEAGSHKTLLSAFEFAGVKTTPLPTTEGTPYHEPAMRAWRQENNLTTEADRVEEMAVRVVLEERDRRVESLVKALAGEPGGYRSLGHAYMDVSGERDLPRVGFVRLMLGDGGGYSSNAQESLISSSWTSVFGDSLTRHLVAEYSTTPGLQTWKFITSSIRTDIDYRLQRAERFGGYGILPVVNQSVVYQPIPSPANEEATYAVAKRGGTEDLTLEAFTAGDGIGVLQRIISSLARAAANTLNRTLLDFWVTNPTTTYDAVTLFSAGHANASTTALAYGALGDGHFGSIGLEAVRSKMRRQASLSDPSDVINAVPRALLVAPELEEIALILTANSRTWPDDEPGLRQPLTVVTVPSWASTTMWGVVADPRSCPTFEVGFTGATPNPDLVLQNDPTIGSAFTSDKITVKIQHVWGLTVLDHRGLQRGNT